MKILKSSQFLLKTPAILDMSECLKLGLKFQFSQLFLLKDCSRFPKKSNKLFLCLTMFRQIHFYFDFVPIFRDFVISYRIFIKKISSIPPYPLRTLLENVLNYHPVYVIRIHVGGLKSYIASKTKHQLTSIATVAKEVKTSYHIQSPYKLSCFESHYVLLPYQ